MTTLLEMARQQLVRITQMREENSLIAFEKKVLDIKERLSQDICEAEVDEIIGKIKEIKKDWAGFRKSTKPGGPIWTIDGYLTERAEIVDELLKEGRENA